jgi:hypothetical protein
MVFGNGDGLGRGPILVLDDYYKGSTNLLFILFSFHYFGYFRRKQRQNPLTVSHLVITILLYVCSLMMMIKNVMLIYKGLSGAY